MLKKQPAHNWRQIQPYHTDLNGNEAKLDQCVDCKCVRSVIMIVASPLPGFSGAGDKQILYKAAGTNKFVPQQPECN